MTVPAFRDISILPKVMGIVIGNVRLNQRFLRSKFGIKNTNDNKMTKYFVMDVDGTLTDGKIYMGQNGEVMKAFNIKDGCGIHDLLIPAGIIPIIITGRKSDIVINRCNEIGITEVYQGIRDKTEKLREVAQTFSDVAYIGDDINDLACMKEVKAEGGLIGCPADAVDKVKEISDYTAIRNGGEGAVRDFIEWLLAENDAANIAALECGYQ